MFLLVWNEKTTDGDLRDCWIACESYVSVYEHYENLLNDDNVHTATICTPIASPEPQYLISKYSEEYLKGLCNG